MRLTRGIRNNNPGNIRWGDKWQGLTTEPKKVKLPEQIVGEPAIFKDESFCMFTTCEYGIRALAKVLTNYQTKFGLKDVRSIINRYAPPIENDTESYINSVARVLGVAHNEPIDVREPSIMINLLKSIIRHENGTQPYTEAQLLEGIRLASQ